MTRLLLRVLGVLFVVAGAVALLAPLPVFTPYDRWAVAASLVGWTVVAWLLRRARPSARVVRLAGVWGPVVVAGLAFVVGLGTAYHVTWDAGVVLAMAGETAHGRLLSPYQLGYLARFPNNAVLFGLDRGMVAVGSVLGVSPTVVFVALNSVSVGICAWLAHRAVVNVGGRGAALAAQAVILGLFGLSPWVSVPYTDVLPAGAALVPAWLLSSPRLRGRLTAPVLAGAVCVGLATGVAIALKATMWVVPAAVAATSLVIAGASTVRRAGVGLLCASLALGLCVVSASTSTRAAVTLALPGHQSLPNDRSWTALMYVDMALQKQHLNGIDRYGTYNGPMVREVLNMTSTQMNTYARSGIRARLADLGPVGVSVFETKAFLWNWGDGSFWAWGEGADQSARSMFTGSVARWVQSWNNPHGRYYGLRGDVMQGLWLLVLIAGGYSLLRCRPRTALLYPTLGCLGVLAFVNLFDGRSRYLFAFVPLIVTTALMGWVLRPGVGEPRPSRAASRSARVTQGIDPGWGR